MWLCPALYDLNASYNKLTHLPLISTCYKDNLDGRGRTVSNPLVSQQKIARSTRRDDAKNTPQQHHQQQQQPHQKRIPVQDHPLKALPTPIPRPAIVPIKEKPIEKANFWPIHSVQAYVNIIENNDELNEDANLNEKAQKSALKSSKTLDALSASQRKESKLVELNLANNSFAKIPECLSCLAPKLIKLNLSSNQIESMGAICDLPLSLKFLDLSNNLIKRPMRLLNESLLKFIIYYFTKYTATDSQTSEFLKINNILVNLLLENEFCYFNLIQKFMVGPNARSNTASKTHLESNFGAASGKQSQILPSSSRYTIMD